MRTTFGKLATPDFFVFEDKSFSLRGDDLQVKIKDDECMSIQMLNWWRSGYRTDIPKNTPVVRTDYMGFPIMITHCCG